MRIYAIYLLMLIPLLLSCRSGRTVHGNITTMEQTILFTPGPKAIVYKTTADYTRNVPVTMDESRTRIVTYPAPSDIYYKGELALPTPLSGGYLLDNRGIGQNSVFLDYTYEEYSRLKEVPSLEELARHIIDKHPFTAMWNCGLRTQYKNEVKELDELIREGFPGCKKIGTNAIIPQKDPDNRE